MRLLHARTHTQARTFFTYVIATTPPISKGPTEIGNEGDSKDDDDDGDDDKLPRCLISEID